MSKLKYRYGKYILQEGENSALILDVRNPLANKSRVHSHIFTETGGVNYPLSEMVNASAKKIFKQTVDSMSEALIYLRTVARLLQKAQIHTVLHVGQWSPLDESLAEILPQFNPANKLYCLSETRPLGKIPSVNFIFAEGGEYLLPEKFFDTIIFQEPQNLKISVLLSLKDYGKIYFAAQISEVSELLTRHARAFPLTEKIVLFEVEVSPQFREKLYRHTPQGKLDEKKSAIIQTVEKLPAVMKKFSSHKKAHVLDEYISEVVRAEKILAEIFPALPSINVKFNFNVLKEFLIDLRLGNGSAARVNRQYEILSKDLSNL